MMMILAMLMIWGEMSLLSALLIETPMKGLFRSAAEEVRRGGEVLPWLARGPWVHGPTSRGVRRGCEKLVREAWMPDATDWKQAGATRLGCPLSSKLFIPQILFSETRFMSTNENLTQSDEIPRSRPSPFNRRASRPIRDREIGCRPAATTRHKAASGALALLHAVRRHWLVILSTGLACAAVIGDSVWLWL